MKFLVLAVALFISTTASSQTLFAVIKGLEGSVNNVLNNGNYVVNNSVNNATINALNLIQTFKEKYDSALNKTITSLTDTERNALNILQNSVNDIISSISKPIAELNAAVDKAFIALSIVFGKSPGRDSGTDHPRKFFKTLP